jgi:NADPH:quinone reductase-like Zn-dependent oxidoreductase
MAGMRAVMVSGFGPPEVLTQVDRPVPVPARGEVLIRVRATTVTAAECRLRRRRSVFRPRILGREFAGEVTAAGPGVRTLRVGDRVFGSTGRRLGCNAEFVVVPERAAVTVMPAGVSFAHAAAAVAGFSTAWRLLRERGNLQAGQRLLVVGASQTTGTYAVQLGRRLGATVHAVCPAGAARLVEELGAERVFGDLGDCGERYDVVFDTGAGTRAAGRALLDRQGRYLPAGRTTARPSAALATLLERGRLRVVIDHTFPMAEIIEAHRRVESGRGAGAVVLQIG